MSSLFKELRDGLDGSNGALARLWRVILKQLAVEPQMWEQWITKWTDKNTDIYGRAAAITKKGNLVRALARRNISWKVFMEALSIINATSRYKYIRFEVHLVPNVGDKTEIMGVNIYSVPKTTNPQTTALSNDSVDLSTTALLLPGDIAEFGKMYLLRGFENTEFNGVIVRNVSGGDLLMSSEYFNDCTVIGQLLVDADGTIDKRWKIYTPPSHHNK